MKKVESPLRAMYMKNIRPCLLLIPVVMITSVAFSLEQQDVQKIHTLSGKELDKADMDVFIKNQMDTLNIKGLSMAIINDAKIVYHLCHGLADVNSQTVVNDQTLFEGASLAKPVFAFFVMQVVEKGILDLDTPLYTYLPYPDAAHDERYKLITARMVLNHTTGFPNWRHDNPDKVLDIKFTPGTHFSYSGEAYMYLAQVVAHLLESDLKNLDRIFQQEVARPLDIEHGHFGLNPYVEKHLATGYMGNKVVYDDSWSRIGFHSASGLYSEAINLAKFLIGIMETKGLKQTSIDEMLKKQVDIPEDDNSRKYLGITEWSLGFGRKPSPYGTNYVHGGNNWGYTSYFLINRKHKFGFVFFTNSNQYNNGKLFNLSQKLEAFLTDGVCDHVPDYVSFH